MSLNYLIDEELNRIKSNIEEVYSPVIEFLKENYSPEIVKEYLTKEKEVIKEVAYSETQIVDEIEKEFRKHGLKRTLDLCLIKPFYHIRQKLRTFFETSLSNFQEITGEEITYELREKLSKDKIKGFLKIYHQQITEGEIKELYSKELLKRDYSWFSEFTIANQILEALLSRNFTEFYIKLRDDKDHLDASFLVQCTTRVTPKKILSETGTLDIAFFMQEQERFNRVREDHEKINIYEAAGIGFMNLYSQKYRPFLESKLRNPNEILDELDKVVMDIKAKLEIEEELEHKRFMKKRAKELMPFEIYKKNIAYKKKIKTIVKGLEAAAEQGVSQEIIQQIRRLEEKETYLNEKMEECFGEFIKKINELLIKDSEIFNMRIINKGALI